jgi:hypothetical protein
MTVVRKGVKDDHALQSNLEPISRYYSKFYIPFRLFYLLFILLLFLCERTR